MRSAIELPCLNSYPNSVFVRPRFWAADTSKERVSFGHALSRNIGQIEIANGSSMKFARANGLEIIICSPYSSVFQIGYFFVVCKFGHLSHITYRSLGALCGVTEFTIGREKKECDNSIKSRVILIDSQPRRSKFNVRIWPMESENPAAIRWGSFIQRRNDCAEFHVIYAEWINRIHIV